MPRASQAGPKRARRATKTEELGVALLREATGASSPFARSDTVYYILGDGSGRRALAAVREAATAAPPSEPIVTVDPQYASESPGRKRPLGAKKGHAAPRNKRRYAPTRQVAYSGERAEDYKFDREALGRAGRAVVVAVGAHTNVGAFVARLRKAAGRGLPVFAVCAPCCFPGLRRPTERFQGGLTGRLQLLYPARARVTGRRPLAEKTRSAEARQARRWRAHLKSASARAEAKPKSRSALRPRTTRARRPQTARPRRPRTTSARRPRTTRLRRRLPAGSRAAPRPAAKSQR